MNSNVVLIFSKHHSIGNTKTRLANSTSREFARDFASACTQDIIRKIRQSNVYDLYFVVDTEEERKMFFSETGIGSLIVDYKEKTGLSEKFASIFRYIFNTLKYDRAILIPSDIPLMSKALLEKSFDKLKSCPYTFGPEENGGVYLIGLNRSHQKNVFKGIRWSTKFTVADLIDNIKTEDYHVLDKLADVNNLDDLTKLIPLIDHNCPNITKLLEKEQFSGLVRKVIA